MQKQQRKYSLLYRVYRRIRFVLYMRKQKRRSATQARRLERADERRRKHLLREKSRADSQSDKEKAKLEREEARRNEMAMKEVYESHQQELARRDAIKIKEGKLAEERERQFMRYRKKRLSRFYRRVCWKRFRSALGYMNPVHLPLLFKYIIEKRHTFLHFFIISLQSTILFIAAYLAVFLAGMLTSAISGLFFDYKTILYFNQVVWLVKPEQWYGDSVKMIYASAPVVMGLIALLFAIFFSYLRTNRRLFKLFVLWVFLHGFNGFFGSLLIGSIFGKGIGYAIIWSYISDTQKVIFSIVSITALFLAGIFTSRSFLLTANSYYNKLEQKAIRRFVRAQVILPFIIGNLLIYAIMSPGMNMHDLLVALSLSISIITIAIAAGFSPSLYFDEEKPGIKLKYGLLAYAAGFIILYRLVLGYGLPIG